MKRFDSFGARTSSSPDDENDPFCDVIFAELEMNFGDCERFEISYEVISARSLSSSLDELDVTVTNLPSRLFHLSFSSLTSGGRFLFRKDEMRSTGS